MGLIHKIKAVFAKKETDFGGLGHEFEKVIESAWEEYRIQKDYFWSVNLNETTIWTSEVKNWPDKKKIQFIIWLVAAIHNYNLGKRSWSLRDEEQQKDTVRQSYLQYLFRNKLAMDDTDAELVYTAFCNHKYNQWATFTRWPVSLMINQLEKQCKRQSITPAMKGVLEGIKKELVAETASMHEKERIKMVEKIDAILFSNENEKTMVKPARFLGNDPFAEMANGVIDALPESERMLWYRLLPLAQKATGSKPSQKYLNDTKEIFKELGADKFKKTLHQWLQFLVSLKEREYQHSYTYGNNQVHNFSTYEFITLVNAEAIKGLVWICAHFHDNATIHVISALAERAFKKIPGKGPALASVGNACLYALYKSKGLDGIGQLSRLKLRVQQASTQALIDKYLQSAAEEKGITIGEIEDMAVDDYGFINGSKSFVLDDHTAELRITGVGKTETKWYKPDSTLQKSVPAVVKEKHAAKLKKIKDTAKQAEQTISAQRDRLDRMFRIDRKIDWQNFEEYYVNHGLMSYLANAIVWNLHQSDGDALQAIHLNNQWVNANNEVVSTSNIATVSLWHPIHASVSDITAWRDFFAFHQLQQPLKQAYREVYLLTDAEVNTKSYSNRMAAHLLRQHQFNSLAKIRGWRYTLMGAFDNGIDSQRASLTLAEHNLRAEYWISEVNADDAMNDTGIWNYVSTDQVRFINTTNNETVDLIDVPPIVFSEVMRDTDLFVGVTSVGNDPAWRDTGGLPAYRDYWTAYSFGELSEVAKNRKEIISKLLPRLKISEVASIKDKFLVVKGKLRTYKIHIGSTNILMKPNDQYLCIVPDRSQKNNTEDVFLPFEGDNGLSIILSKAFLLADDDKITDKSITSQINRS